MSWVGIVTLAWAAVHGWLAFFYARIYTRRASDTEYLAYAALSAGLGIYCVGAAILTEATSLASGAVGMRISSFGAPIAIGAAVVFAHLISNDESSRLPRLTLFWTAVGLVGDLGGLFADPDVPSAGVATGHGAYTQPAVTPFGIVWFVGACLLVGWASVHLLRTARTDRDARFVAIASALGAGAAAHDLVVHVLGLDTLYLLEHASIAVAFLLGRMLLGRFAATAELLAERTDELEKAHSELRRARREVVRRQQLAAVGELSAVIAHEVRNPLAILKNAASGLRRPKLGADDRTTLLDILDEEGARLGAIATDLLTYARPIAPATDELSVPELLAGVRPDGPPNIEVTLEVDESLPAIRGDRELLERALAAIVENAVQAMPEGGSLALRARGHEIDGRPGVAIAIVDTGSGMDALVREKATDPFFTTRPSGTGLGLSIAERVVRAHGGRLSLESRHGAGTSVRVELPATGSIKPDR